MPESRSNIGSILLAKFSIEGAVFVLMMSLFFVWLVQSYLDKENITLGAMYTTILLLVIPVLAIYITKASVRAARPGQGVVSGVILILIVLGLAYFGPMYIPALQSVFNPAVFSFVP